MQEFPRAPEAESSIKIHRSRDSREVKCHKWAIMREKRERCHDQRGADTATMLVRRDQQVAKPIRVAYGPIFQLKSKGGDKLLAVFCEVCDKAAAIQ